MAVHHVKGQPAALTYVQEKGVLLLTLIVLHPVYVSTWTRCDQLLARLCFEAKIATTVKKQELISIRLLLSKPI